MKAWITKGYEPTPIEILNAEVTKRGVSNLLGNPILAGLLRPITGLLTTHMLGIIGARNALADLASPQGTLEKTPHTDSIIENLRVLAEIEQAIDALNLSRDQAMTISKSMIPTQDPQQLRRLEAALSVLERYPSMQAGLSAAQTYLEEKTISDYNAILALVQEAQAVQEHRDEINDLLSLFKQRLFQILHMLGVSLCVADGVIKRTVREYDALFEQKHIKTLYASTLNMTEAWQKIGPIDIKNYINEMERKFGKNMPQAPKSPATPPFSKDNKSIDA